MTGDGVVGRDALGAQYGERLSGAWSVEGGELEEHNGMVEFGISGGGGWISLKEALSTVEVEALSLVLRGDMGIKAFADRCGVMLEVLADGINEKAFDHIGDSILEMDDGMSVFDEYKEKVAELVTG